MENKRDQIVFNQFGHNRFPWLLRLDLNTEEQVHSTWIDPLLVPGHESQKAKYLEQVVKYNCKGCDEAELGQSRDIGEVADNEGTELTDGSNGDGRTYFR